MAETRKLTPSELEVFTYFVNKVHEGRYTIYKLTDTELQIGSNSPYPENDPGVKALWELFQTFSQAELPADQTEARELSEKIRYLLPILEEVALILIANYINNPDTYSHALILSNMVQNNWKQIENDQRAASVEYIVYLMRNSNKS